MSQELETAAAGSFGEFFRFRRHNEHAAPLGTPCANCATPLQGPWCHQCGQVGEDFHRSILRLIGELVEGLFHFDGRVWTTLPELFRNPGRLTRSFLDGHRAPQIPPLRLFLVVLLLVFFASAIGGRGDVVQTITTDDHGKVISTKTRTLSQLSPQERAETKRIIATTEVKILSGGNAAVGDWLKVRLGNVLDDPERFKLVLEQWSERFAFLSLPLASGLLSLLFVFQRRFFIFDHTIFSLHSLSAVGLMLALAAGFSRITVGWSHIVLLAAPVHLFTHMRGVYGTSILGTLLRMLVLFIGSMVGALLILAAFLLTGLSVMAS